MNKLKAMRFLEDLLKHDFKYIFNKQNLSIGKWHLTFKMDRKAHELQMTLDFNNTYVDVLCFPHPKILKDENYIAALKTVNYINWIVKANGRFYIDDYSDIAYSLRLDYKILETMPHESVKEIQCAIEFYIDLFQILLQVCQGTATYEESREYVDSVWN